MKIRQVSIEGYRSIRQRIHLHVEESVTVVLGPNDHGKTNLLNALLHLNADMPFAGEDDLNWDSTESDDSLPSLIADFILSEGEREWLFKSENEARTGINDRIAERDQQQDESGRTSEEIESEDMASEHEDEEDEDEGDEETESAEDADDDLPSEPLPLMPIEAMPQKITVKRVGVKGPLTVHGLEDFTFETQDGFVRFLPRFELIAPITNLSDTVTAEALKPGNNEFMRGIFYYAGLNPDQCSDLFEQNDRTQMQITRASEKLNSTLKQSWSQGKSLHFRLTHDSEHKRIGLQIEDPAVASTYVRASRRSSGFTHYFSLKTILYSRQNDHPAESYVLLFDEPGVFLHPSGQFDLLQVLETLALESQLLYVTHSLFMINKTFPTRHRLVMKTENGTTLDGKPYVGRWQSVLSALGMTLTGSILFANHVVLTEGDSDPLYIYAMIQKAVKAGKCNLDIKSLAVMSTGESKHTDVLLRILLETDPKPRIAMLLDGDRGGKDRQKAVHKIITAYDIAERTLAKGTSIEDHLPMIREVYVPAVASYVGKLIVLEGKAKPDEAELEQRFVAAFDSEFKPKTTQGIADWAARVANSIGGIEGTPSKVGIAREYCTRLLEIDDETFKLDSRSKALIEWIHTEAGVPEIHPVENKILK